MGHNGVLQRLHEHLPSLRARHHVRRLDVYGSTARGDARPDSDVDIIGSFEQVPSLFDMAHLKTELERILGRTVDLATPGGLHPRILRTAQKEGV